VITVGNQLDLTVADWVEALAADAQLRAFACYVEGFPQGEGLRLAQLAARLAAERRLLILYRAGRTREGAAASASHTASLAGDPAATRSLLTAAGALVAESIDDFEDLLVLAASLADRTVEGPGCGVVSNAGFECVAMADSLGLLRLADLGTATRARLAEAFAAARIDGFVDVHHPLDLTPLCGDAPFVAAAEAVLADPAVQVGLVGCVPLTQALATLPDEVERTGGIAERLADLWQRTTKAWVAVVDSGGLYDAFAARLARAGVPVFRSADRAARLLGRYAGWRLRAAGRPR
jgi:acyl-CoA synthetase (NDP forming)